MIRRLAPLLLGVPLITMGLAPSAGAPPTAVVRAAVQAASGDPTVVAAGDIACSPQDASFNRGAGTAKRCNQRATAALIGPLNPTAVLPLGDDQYDQATASEFAGSYNPTWGVYKAITHPAVGNHEYETKGAAGYFAYFGAAAGDPKKGYYSFDVGAWHLIALNANCGKVGGCQAGSAQERWLAADLAAHPAACTLAYWHQPRFSSARQGDNAATAAFWSDLYAAHADVVLNGHHHHYERFAPMNPSGRDDAAHGVREFVVGTGGENLAPFATPEPASQAQGHSFGVLQLTLHPSSYDWKFVPTTAGGFTDSGTQACH